MIAAMTILVTGGAGYIGTHTCVELLLAGQDVAVLDNLANSSAVALDRVRSIVGRGSLTFHQVDLCDAAAVERVFAQVRPSAVIHFAGLKAVGESVQIPLRYSDNNIGGTLVLLEAMKTEIRISAPADGVVESVGCSAGESVEEGTELVVLKAG